MSDNPLPIPGISSKRVFWWAILAGIGFTLGGELAGAPFRLAYLWLNAQFGTTGP